ncbi:MAG TPA: helix-turn-helix domain-containing protein [Flavisolibacter sp.]|nr:helix-turn-helix domain-containing protein [Flavisolibacter sp.]
MPFYFSRYSGLLLIFFVHGLVYAFLLLRKGIKNGRASDKWLALFLFLCVLYICPWMLGFAGWYDGFTCLRCRNFLFYMPFQHTLLMGPAIYFYLRNLFQPTLKFQKKDWLHFIPPALYIAWCAVVFVTDRIILKKYYLMNGITDPDFDSWYILAGLLSLLFYLLLCFRYYKEYKQFIVQQASFADDVTFRWVRNFLIACFVYFLSNLVFHLIPLFGVDVDYIGSWWYYLFFALLFYYVAINGYSNSIETRVQLSLDLLRYKKQPLLSAPADQEEIFIEDLPFEEVSPAKEEADIQPWKAKVLEAVVANKMYANPELTLSQLAKYLQTNNTLLSKVINTGFGQNFNDFINYYRVEDVKQKLQSGSASDVTIMSLAYDAGFNSKATFNRAFKKVTGKNPKEFLERD